ncbi:MAG: CapA family protein [Clostridia bacterium]|nr:CapA family protein [Clostridia bacterium]
MKLIFTGDVNFRNMYHMNEQTASEILEKVLPYTEQADFRIVNLEEPLADEEKYEPIYKSGPNLIAPQNCISFLDVLGVDVAVLANNHTGDYGDGAIKDTLALLDAHGIKHAGAGKNIDEAYNSVILEKDGTKVSILSVCENEFGIATETKYGSAGYNARRLLNKIKSEKERADVVIVIFHGGNEYNPLPAPVAVDRYRLICDMGADAVIAMHTHCPQGFETYDGKPIVYSMGNFLFQSFGEKDSKDSWFYGYMSILNIDADKKISLEVLPYNYYTGNKINVFEGDDKEKMMAYLKNISDIIQDPEELHRYYMGWCCGYRYFPKSVDEYCGLKGTFAAAKNLLTCEAHCDKLRENYRILNDGEEDLAREYEIKAKELMKMPV